MHTTLAERLRQAMEGPPKVTGKALAAACGVKPPSVSDWLSGKSKTMVGQNLIAAAEFLRVRPKWLAEGVGPMRLEEHRPGGFYQTEGQALGVGLTFADDESVILKLTEGNASLRQEWLLEAVEFHDRRGTLTRPQAIAAGESQPVSYLPDRKPDALTAELLHLFSQLDDVSKREYLAHLRGFVAGRRPHTVGGAPAVAG